MDPLVQMVTTHSTERPPLTISVEKLASRISDEERLRVAKALIVAAHKLCSGPLADSLAAFSEIEQLKHEIGAHGLN